MTVQGNVISGNFGDGVTLDGAANAVVADNLIGTDATGTATTDSNGGYLSNFGNGVTVQGAAFNDTIGGPNAGDGNLISGNFGNGVEVVAGTGSLIQGNDIGANLAGTVAAGNYGNGVSIEASGTDLLGNVVSGNYGYGVWVAANSSVIQRNLIGTETDGTDACPNQTDGVYIAGSDNLVGGAGAGQGNVIAFNMGNGVTVDSGTQNTISRNSIYSNSSPYAGYPGIGIDLGDNGVTLNDSMGHTGPNLYQDFPVLTTAQRSGANVTVEGTMTEAPSQSYMIEFFSNTAADPSGYGQGQTFVGSAVVTTNASGTASYTATLAGVPANQNILTATATDAAGNTSEFCAAINITKFVVVGPAATATTLNVVAEPLGLRPDRHVHGHRLQPDGGDHPHGLGCVHGRFYDVGNRHAECLGTDDLHDLQPDRRHTHDHGCLLPHGPIHRQHLQSVGPGCEPGGIDRDGKLRRQDIRRRQPGVHRHHHRFCQWRERRRRQRRRQPDDHGHRRQFRRRLCDRGRTRHTLGQQLRLRLRQRHVDDQPGCADRDRQCGFQDLRRCESGVHRRHYGLRQRRYRQRRQGRCQPDDYRDRQQFGRHVHHRGRLWDARCEQLHVHLCKRRTDDQPGRPDRDCQRGFQDLRHCEPLVHRRDHGLCQRRYRQRRQRRCQPDDYRGRQQFGRHVHHRGRLWDTRREQLHVHLRKRDIDDQPGRPDRDCQCGFQDLRHCEPLVHRRDHGLCQRRYRQRRQRRVPA